MIFFARRARPISLALLVLAGCTGSSGDDDDDDMATEDGGRPDVFTPGRNDPTSCCVLCEGRDCTEACGCNSTEVDSLPARESVMSTADEILFAVQTDRVDAMGIPVAYFADFRTDPPGQRIPTYCLLFSPLPEGGRRFYIEAIKGDQRLTLSSHLDGQCAISLTTSEVQVTGGCNEGDRCVLSRAIGRDPAMLDVRCTRLMGTTPNGQEPVSFAQTFYVRGCYGPP